MRSADALIAASLTLLLAAHAAAQQPDWDAAESDGSLDRAVDESAVDLEPVVIDPYRGQLAIETAFFRRSTSGVTTTFISPLLSFAHRIGDSGELGARFGLAGAVLDGPTGGLGGLAGLDGSRLRAGNPELTGGYYHAFVAWPRTLEFRVLAGVALPLASVPTPTLGGGSGPIVSSAALGGAAATRGLRDSWLWLPDALGIVLPSVRVHMTQDALELGASVDLAVLVPTAHTSSRDVGLRGQLMLSAAYHMVRALRMGAAFSAVAQLSKGRLGGDSVGGDDFQSSVDVFAGVDSGGAMLELRFTTNLDAPFGFSFDDDGVWGLRLNLGVRLP